MKTKQKILLAGCIVATCLGSRSATAEATVQAWYHLGDVADYYADSSPNNRRIGSAYSHVPWNNPASPGNFNGVNTPTGVGGPLGTSGFTSVNSLRAGRWGTMICTMWNAAGYVPPAKDFFIEIWVQPHGKGYVYGSTGAWIFSANSGRGLGLRVKDDGEKSYFVGTITDATSADVGTPVLVDTNRWTHLALVNDNGTVTFYVNGVANGPSNTGTAVSTPTGDVQFGRDNAGFDGLMDEARICTFAPGQFSTNDFLLRPPGPQILGQPANAIVWDGGAAPFIVKPVIDPDVTFQWKQGENDIAGATEATLVLPQVAPADSGSSFKCLLTSSAISVTSTVATLTVAPVRTADVEAYRNAVMAEASLMAYFPVDNDLGAILKNVKDASHNGTLELAAGYDGRTNRSFGQRAVWFNKDGHVQVPNDPGYEFGGGNGTIEALVFLESATGEDSTIVACADDAGAGANIGYALMVSGDGSSLVYTNDFAYLSWPIPTSLVGRMAHVALTFGNGVAVTAYVDGQSLGTKIQDAFGNSYGAPLWIGAIGSGATTSPRRWIGSVDELALYSSVLSTATLQTHYSRYVYGTNTAPPSIVSQPSSKTVLAGSAPIMAVTAAGTLPLTYQWKLNGTPIAGANSPTLAAAGGAAGTTATYTLAVENAFGSTESQPIVLTFVAASGAYAQAVAADHPSSYWRLGESAGPLAADASGFNDATYVGSVTLGEPGAFLSDADTAMRIGGDGARAEAPYTPALNPSTPFTVEFLAKPAVSGQTSRCVIGSQNRNVGRSGYAIYQGLNGAFWEVHMGDSSTVQIWMFGKSAPVAGQWYHVAFVYDPSLETLPARIYVNGVDDTDYDNSYTQNNANYLPNGSAKFEIGTRFGGGVPYNGTLDDVAFYNYALSANSISNHWKFTWTPSAIVNNPADTTAVEGDTLTLTASASGYPNTYQWLKDGIEVVPTENADGTAHYPQGVTSPTLVISQVKPTDAGSYRLVVSNPLANSATTDARVTITRDETKPTVVSVTALPTPKVAGGKPYLVKVVFSKRMEANSAGNAANYAIPGVTFDKVTFLEDVRAAVLGADWRTVILATSGLTPGQPYNLTVSGVKDQTVNGNTVASTTLPFTAPVLTPGLASWDYYYIGAPATGETFDINSLLNSPLYPDAPMTNGVSSTFDTTPLTNGDLNNTAPFGALGDYYGVSLVGWVTPKVSGNYTFFLASDDNSQLFLSTDANPANAVLVAYESGCCHGFVEPPVEYTYGPAALVAGQSYFIQAVQTEGGGGDYVKVAWRMEGDETAAASLKPIPAEFLSAYASVPAPKFNPVTISGGQITISWTGTGTLYESTDLRTWSPVPGNPASPYVLTSPTALLKFYRLQQ